MSQLISRTALVRASGRNRTRKPVSRGDEILITSTARNRAIRTSVTAIYLASFARITGEKIARITDATPPRHPVFVKIVL